VRLTVCAFPPAVWGTDEERVTPARDPLARSSSQTGGPDTYQPQSCLRLVSRLVSIDHSREAAELETSEVVPRKGLDGAVCTAVHGHAPESGVTTVCCELTASERIKVHRRWGQGWGQGDVQPLPRSPVRIQPPPPPAPFVEQLRPEVLPEVDKLPKSPPGLRCAPCARASFPRERRWKLTSMCLSWGEASLIPLRSKWTRSRASQAPPDR
jgi:hypothetical protein